MGQTFGRTLLRVVCLWSLCSCLWLWGARPSPVHAEDAPQPPAAKQPPPQQTQCIDEAIRDELNARRRYRGVQSRLFQKAGRHELSAIGGLYASDLLSSSFLVGGAYTFHFTEDLG